MSTATPLQTKREEYQEVVRGLKESLAPYETNPGDTPDEVLRKCDEDEALALKLQAEIATLERSERIKNLTVPKTEATPTIRSGKSKITRSDCNDAVKAFLSKNTSLWDASYAEAAEKVGFNYRTDDLVIRLRSQSDLIQRDQTIATPSAGGYSVNETVVQAFEKALDSSEYPWQSLFTVHRKGHGKPWSYVLSNDTNKGGYYAELEQVTPTAHTFSRVTFGAYKIASGIERISTELIEDSEIDILSVLGSVLADRLNRTLWEEFTVGDGSGNDHITGFTEDSQVSGDATYVDAVTYQDLVGLLYSVPEKYRVRGTFMVHSDWMRFLVGMVDDVNRPLFQAYSGGMNEAPRGTLLGRPIVVNDFLDNTVEAGAPVVYFGDFSRYHVSIARDIQIRQSGLNERHLYDDCVSMAAFARVDGKLVDASGSALKHLVLNSQSGAPSIND